MKKGCITVVLLAVILAAVLVFAGPRLWEAGMKFLYPQSYSELVEREAAEFHLDPDLIYAVIKTESGFDPQARSRADAQGLMQLTQETFEWIGSLYPPENGGEMYSTLGIISIVAARCCGCCWTSMAVWMWPWLLIMRVWATCRDGLKAVTIPTMGKRCIPSLTRKPTPM